MSASAGSEIPEEEQDAEDSDCGAYTDPEMMARQRRILTKEEGEAFLRSLLEPPGEITPEIRRALLNYKRLVRETEEDLSEMAAASKSSLGFWDNPVDDEVWNDV